MSGKYSTDIVFFYVFCQFPHYHSLNRTFSFTNSRFLTTNFYVFYSIVQVIFYSTSSN